MFVTMNAHANDKYIKIINPFRTPGNMKIKHLNISRLLNFNKPAPLSR
jgi:hypothetical protein